MNSFIIFAIAFVWLFFYSLVKHREAKIIEQAYEKKEEEYRKLRLLIEQSYGKKGGE